MTRVTIYPAIIKKLMTTGRGLFYFGDVFGSWEKVSAAGSSPTTKGEEPALTSRDSQLSRILMSGHNTFGEWNFSGGSNLERTMHVLAIRNQAICL